MPAYGLNKSNSLFKKKKTACVYSYTYSVSLGSCEVVVLFSTYAHQNFQDLNNQTLKNTIKEIKFFSYSQINEQEKKYLVQYVIALANSQKKP